MTYINYSQQSSFEYMSDAGDDTNSSLTVETVKWNDDEHHKIIDLCASNGLNIIG